MELREVLAALRSAWWLPVVGLLVGGAAAFAVSRLTVPLYTSSIQLFVSTTDSTSTTAVFQGSQFSQERVTSYAQLIGGEEVASRVVDELGLDVAPAQLASQISAEAVRDTVLLDVAVTDASPERAQLIAGSVGAQFIALVAELETPDNGAASPVKVTVVNNPDLPLQPSSPQTLRDVALGSFLGLLLGIGAAIARARLDRTVKAPEDAAELAGAPITGVVLRDTALENQRTIDRASMNRTAEEYRQLRTNLQFLNVDAPPRVIMVSSALPSEGKTTVVINLGLTLADAGLKVTILEADLRRPRVTRYLGMVGGVGLTNLLAGTADLASVVQPYGDGKLSVIGSGPTPPNPGELLSSSHMSELLEQLRDDNDYVLVDAPPLLPVADATGMAAMMDGVLVVVRYGSTRKDQLRHAAAALGRVGARTLGVILNIVPPSTSTAQTYGYGYGYGPDADTNADTQAGAVPSVAEPEQRPATSSERVS